MVLQTGLGAIATKFAVDGMTMGWPSRPTWAGPAGAFGFGIFFVALQTIVLTGTMNPQLAALAVLNGVIVGGVAMGLTASGNAAEAKRRAAMGPEPARAAPRRKGHP